MNYSYNQYTDYGPDPVSAYAEEQTNYSPAYTTQEIYPQPQSYINQSYQPLQPQQPQQQLQQQPSDNEYGFKKINLNKIIGFLGQPDLIDPYRGGVVVWKRKTLKRRGLSLLKRVEVSDEPPILSSPVPHIASVTCWFNAPLTIYQRREVSQVNPLYIYDCGKKWMMIRTHDIGVNITLYSLLLKYKRGKISLSELSSPKLIKKYFIFGQKVNLVKLIKSFK